MTLALAIEKALDYYDAAFMFHASKLDLVLVTDDKPFQGKVNSTVAWMDSARLIATGGVIGPAGDEVHPAGDRRDGHGRPPGADGHGRAP